MANDDLLSVEEVVLIDSDYQLKKTTIVRSHHKVTPKHAPTNVINVSTVYSMAIVINVLQSKQCPDRYVS